MKYSLQYTLDSCYYFSGLLLYLKKNDFSAKIFLESIKLRKEALLNEPNSSTLRWVDFYFTLKGI